MNFFDISFWQGFLSNLLATLIGAFVGIYLALQVDRRKESSTEKEKNAKILQVLSVELNENRLKISMWNEAGKDDESMTTMGALLSDEIWNTFSDGGELQWIKDPFLLSELAFTYAEIKRIKYLSDKYLHLVGLHKDTKLRKDISNE